MQTFLRAAPLAAALLLGACDNSPTTVVSGPADPMQGQLATAKPVELPPAMEASKSYRCDDNSVVSIDWMTGGKQANLHPRKDAPIVILKADDAGQPLLADGYALDGTSKAGSVSLATPGKSKQSCKG